MEQELFTPQEHMSASPFVSCISEVRVVHFDMLHVFNVLAPFYDVRYDFRHKTMFGLFLFLFVLSGIIVSLMLFVFIYVY